MEVGGILREALRSMGVRRVYEQGIQPMVQLWGGSESLLGTEGECVSYPGEERLTPEL